MWGWVKFEGFSQSIKKNKAKAKCGEKERVRKDVEKMGKHLNFYAKQSDLTHTYFFHMPMILFLYKKAYFNTNKLYSCVPGVCVSQEFEDVFPIKFQVDCHLQEE